MIANDSAVSNMKGSFHHFLGRRSIWIDARTPAFTDATEAQGAVRDTWCSHIALAGTSHRHISPVGPLAVSSIKARNGTCEQG